MNNFRVAIAKELDRRRNKTVVASAIKSKQSTLIHTNLILASEKPDVALAIGLLPLAGKMAIKGAQFNFRVLKALTKASAWLLLGYRKKPDSQKAKYREKLIKTAALAYIMASNGLDKIKQQIKAAGTDAKEVVAKFSEQKKQLQKVRSDNYATVHNLIDKKRDPQEYAKTRKIMGLKA